EQARTADMAEETKQAVTRLADLGVQQRAAESEQKGLEACVADYRTRLADTPVRLQAATVTTIHNPVIAQLQSSIVQLQVQKAGLLKEYQPDSPEVRQLDAQLKEANARIGSEMDRVVGERTEALNPVYQKLMEEFVKAEAARVAVTANVVGLKQAVAEGKAELSQRPSRRRRWRKRSGWCAPASSSPV